MLKEKVAVITGASSGIGASSAKLLAQEEATVVLAARREEKIRELALQIRATGQKALDIRCDVTIRKEAEELIHRTVKEFGRIDIDLIPSLSRLMSKS